MYKLYALFVVVAVSLVQQSFAEAEPQSKYFIPNFTANWFKAVEYCHYLGQKLATIGNRETETILFEAIKTTDIFHNVSTRVWVGANDLADEGSFHWHATGKRVQYSNWAPSTPDNYGNNEDCVEVGIHDVDGEWGYSWQWNDDDCQKPKYFACENGNTEIRDE